LGYKRINEQNPEYQELNEESKQLLRARIASASGIKYDKCYEDWLQYCAQEKISPDPPCSPHTVSNFLSVQFEKVKELGEDGESKLKGYRSLFFDMYQCTMKKTESPSKSALIVGVMAGLTRACKQRKRDGLVQGKATRPISRLAWTLFAEELSKMSDPFAAEVRAYVNFLWNMVGRNEDCSELITSLELSAVADHLMFSSVGSKTDQGGGPGAMDFPIYSAPFEYKICVFHSMAVYWMVMPEAIGDKHLFPSTPGTTSTQLRPSAAATPMLRECMEKFQLQCGFTEAEINKLTVGHSFRKGSYSALMAHCVNVLGSMLRAKHGVPGMQKIYCYEAGQKHGVARQANGAQNPFEFCAQGTSVPPCICWSRAGFLLCTCTRLAKLIR
jgi:hypothetical protein